MIKTFTSAHAPAMAHILNLIEDGKLAASRRNADTLRSALLDESFNYLGDEFISLNHVIHCLVWEVDKVLGWAVALDSVHPSKHDLPHNRELRRACGSLREKYPRSLVGQ